ncbi:hypothetical protein RhiirA4_479393 [Rhizophagus irregularis]|uniref:Uncharacterized protein n=1 Tax=Rhizophagus irregularis TaxID=588596 RepID=A0A2I1HGD5_9GLOM|nr:hypothetical protein RhiirA4_479393 [Rhizophagus irregularis]
MENMPEIFLLYTDGSSDTFGSAIRHIDSTLQQEETSINSLNKHHELQNL